MANTIITKNSATATAIPTAGQLVQGELAVNVTDKRLFTENSGGTVVELGTNPSQVNFADNAKAIFGNGSDLQIYHNGNNSFITDVGTGSLYFEGATSVNIRETVTGLPMAVFTGSGSTALYHSGIKKFETTSTGIDVTGTVVADGLTLASGSAVDFTAATVSSESYLNVNIDSNNNQTGQTFNITHDDGSKYLFTASESGDISFYEDTGTTPKFFWDASAESLGIGTSSSPSAKLELAASNGGITDPLTSVNRIRFTDTDTTKANNQVTGGLEWYSSDTDPVGAGVYAYLSSATDNTGAGWISFATGSPSTITERARITSAGDLLVGKTVAGAANQGVDLQASGIVVATRPDNISGLFNRTNTDGAIVDFRKNNTTVGVIGVEGGDSLYIQSGTTTGSGLHFHPTAGNVNPARNGAKVDNAIDLGRSTHRFKDLYLSGGVYVGGTSAANLLDDYEEGSWTLELYDAATGGNKSSTSVAAHYTKIGDVVTICLGTSLVNVSTAGMTAGNVLYFTLPFAPRSRNFSGTVLYDNFDLTNRTTANPFTSGTARAIIKTSGDGVGDGNIIVGDILSGATDIFAISMTYTTAS